ncbi:C25 family cysteine peptidase [Chitinispirillales bacterium ANBcel5]|uniref:C25 family cysteine peptidase n=1 Tax=Cellulosispirillum alkaliphilum TaxID=3039283 RepID=UPI002A520ECC|nr:C25 family cysteine peptidase [Chitinispirillales bacterium ANBcel5]
MVSLLLILLIYSFVSAFSGSEFSNISVHSSGFSIDFSLTNSSGHQSSGFVFGYTCSPSSKGARTVTAELGMNESEIYPLKIEPIVSDWSANNYIQWCEISIPDNLKNRSSVLDGTITFSGIDGLRKDGISTRNNVILIDQPQRVLTKSASHHHPQLPFDQGVRIDVTTDGLYQLSVGDLLELGVSVNTVPARFFRMFQKNNEIALYSTAGNSEYFSHDDLIVFYGQHLRGENSHFTQYSNTNTYWLSWDTTPGNRMMEISGAQRRDLRVFDSHQSSDAVKAGNFHDTIHIEYDNEIRWLGSIYQPSDIASIPVTDTLIDNWYWGLMGANDLTSYTIQLPSPAESGLAQVLISMTGLTRVAGDRNDHIYSILINGKKAGNDNSAVWKGQRPYIFTSDPFPVDLLNKGDNRIDFINQQHEFENRAALNWIRVIYPRNYEASDNSLLFRNDESTFDKLVQYEVDGFDDNNIELWDIEQNRFFTETTIKRNETSNPGTYSLVFQDSVSLTSRYLAQSVTNRLTPDSIKLDTLAAKWDTLAGVDYIAISVDSFKTVLEPLLQTHRSRGLRTAFVDIGDIYDRFSFGIPNPESIRLFISFLFSISGDNPPRFLLLGGDTTHDLDKKNGDRNLVPTNLARIPGWGPASNDGYFVTVRGDNQFPDMAVGRFPAQNKEEMKTLVTKTVNYINNPSRGFWRDNILLAGGGKRDEPEFTRFNNQITTEVIGSQMNILRMDADPSSPWYKNEFNASGAMADFINAGVYLVNFNGHGGGNVWSDNRFFSYNDIHRLHNGGWGGSGKLPIIFSFTCLTGFFESRSYRSLGEELVRFNEHGAIAFYGASSYTSRNGNIIINRLLLDQGLNGNFETLGELLKHTETLMLVKYGREHLPLIRQYNLLGDPALPWHLTPDSVDLTLSNELLSEDERILLVEGKSPSIEEGHVLVQLQSDSREWTRKISTVEDSGFKVSIPVKEGTQTSRGYIRAYVWNDSAEMRGSTPFSKNNLLIYDLKISPSTPAFGDSVTVRCRAHVPDGSSIPQLFLLYSTAPPHGDFKSQGGILMNRDSSGVYTSTSAVPVIYGDRPGEMLQLRFRMVAGAESIESSRFTYDILGRPDLLFSKDSLSFQWSDDSLFLSFEVLNSGNVTAPPFSVDLNWVDTETAQRTRFHQRTAPDSLLPGTSHPFRISLPDTTGTLIVEASINSDTEFEEISFENNIATREFSISKGLLHVSSDTVTTPGDDLSLTPQGDLSKAYSVFIFSEELEESQPLSTASHWIPSAQNNHQKFTIGTRPALKSSDTLLWTFSTEADNSDISVMTRDQYSGNWRYAGNSSFIGGNVLFRSSETGPYAIAHLSDNSPPRVRLTVVGREISFLDYVAKDRPFNLGISDPSGIYTPSIRLLLNGKELTQESHSEIPLHKNPENVNVTVYPPSQRNIDSLLVLAEDLAGNRISETFAYKPGEDLKIQFLSCHPNPFTARVSDGVTVENVRFAFLITDLADIELTIYTSSGRNIRSWRFPDLIGYQEIQWDGRDRHGYRIANGTYFAKLTARNNFKRVNRTIRIAKLEGYR